MSGFDRESLPPAAADPLRFRAVLEELMQQVHNEGRTRGLGEGGLHPQTVVAALHAGAEAIRTAGMTATQERDPAAFLTLEDFRDAITAAGEAVRQATHARNDNRTEDAVVDALIAQAHATAAVAMATAAVARRPVIL